MMRAHGGFGGDFLASGDVTDESEAHASGGWGGGARRRLGGRAGGGGYRWVPLDGIWFVYFLFGLTTASMAPLIPTIRSDLGAFYKY